MVNDGSALARLEERLPQAVVTALAERGIHLPELKKILNQPYVMHISPFNESYAALLAHAQRAALFTGSLPLPFYFSTVARTATERFVRLDEVAEELFAGSHMVSGVWTYASADVESLPSVRIGFTDIERIIEEYGGDTRIQMQSVLTALSKKVRETPYTKVENVQVYRFAGIPDLSRVELATLTLPRGSVCELNESEKAKYRHDLSLELVLMPSGDAQERIALRILLLRKDTRIPEAERKNYGHVFAVKYTPEGQVAVHMKSYPDAASLISGVRNSLG